MKTYIVLISVDNNDSRKICELIENSQIQSTRLVEEIPMLSGVEFQVYGLDDFMELANDQQIDLESWFMTYIHLV